MTRRRSGGFQTRDGGADDYQVAFVLLGWAEAHEEGLEVDFDIVVAYAVVRAAELPSGPAEMVVPEDLGLAGQMDYVAVLELSRVLRDCGW